MISPLRLLLPLMLAAPFYAQVTQPTGYHIVVTPPGETYATPTASSTSTSTSAAGKIRPPAGRGKRTSGTNTGITGTGIRPVSMPTRISGSFKKH